MDLGERRAATLYETAPQQFRVWIQAAIWGAFLGYLGSSIGIWIAFGESAVFADRDPWVAAMCAAAIVAGRRGYPESAARVVLVVVWVELLSNLALSSEGIRSPSALAVPVVILAASVLFDRRWMLSLAVANSVFGPLLVWVGGQWGAGPGLTSADAHVVSVFVATNVITATMMSRLLTSYLGAVAEARANERRAAGLIEEAPDAIIALDAEGKIAAFNRMAERIIGVPRDQALGRPISALPLTAVDEVDGEANTGRTTELTLELTGKTLEVVARRRSAVADAEATMTLILRDVTERKIAEERAKSLRAQLQHAQKLEAVGLLAGGIAHDFNNLLTAVGGYASLIADTSDGETHEMALGLIDAQERGVALTRQLLAFSRQDVTQPEPIMLGEVIKGMEALLSRLVGEHVTLDIDPGRGAWVFADPGQLEQVLINLAANARDAIEVDGTVYVGCRVDADEVELIVRDTGKGIPAHVCERVFEPFYTTKPRGKGTGLGLSTVHGIVTESKGTIQVLSKEGEGAAFHIRWPLCRIGEARAIEIEASGPVQMPTATILMAEDDEHTRSFIRRVLERAGFHVVVARSGQEAVTVAHGMQAPPDLLLTDVIMPGMTGIELAERLRKLIPGLHVLYMSGYVDDVIGADEIDLINDLVMKPFSAADLLKRIALKLPQQLNEQSAA